MTLGGRQQTTTTDNRLQRRPPAEDGGYLRTVAPYGMVLYYILLCFYTMVGSSLFAGTAKSGYPTHGIYRCRTWYPVPGTCFRTPPVLSLPCE